MSHWVYNDGGRAEAGFKGKAGDCLTRALSIITNHSYKEIHDLVDSFSAEEKVAKKQRHQSGADAGVYKKTAMKVVESLGGKWISCMGVGTGCKVHLRAEELPSGRIIARVSHHFVAVIDGIIYDTFDPSRGGNRCVYGYWRF